MNQSLSYEFTQVMPTVTQTLGWPSLFTAQAPSGAFSVAGEPDGAFVDVDGLTNIPCTAPPNSNARLQATELKALTEITASEMHHVLLKAWYPSLDAGWRGDGTPAGAWRCVVDGVAYDILGVESDSHSIMTRVSIKLATI